MKTGQLHGSLMFQYYFTASTNNIIFSPPWPNIPLILQESANVTCTQPSDPSPSSFLPANFVARREKKIWLFQRIEPGILQWEADVITTMLPNIAIIQILQLFYSRYHNLGLTLDIFLFSVLTQDVFFSALPQPPTPRYLAVSIHWVDRAHTFDK